MKKCFYLFAGLSLACFFSFKAPEYNLRSSTAEVNQYEGLLIFSDCRPAKDYTVLGTVKGPSLAMNGNYESIRDKLIKAARKEYSGADGIILNLKNGGTDKADVIKFK